MFVVSEMPPDVVHLLVTMLQVDPLRKAQFIKGAVSRATHSCAASRVIKLKVVLL